MAKLYSYIRWSSERQADGSTKERQKDTNQKLIDSVALEHNLEVVEIMDEGVSAFKGKNIKEGAMGDFIDAVKGGAIEQDSWLVLENLDRFSRQNHRLASRLLEDLVDLGISIKTPLYHLDKTILDENPMMSMMILLEFDRAHKESKIKQERTVGSALRIIKLHEDGERSDDGYALAIKAVAQDPFFVDRSDGYVREHEIYYPIARKICEMLIANMTVGAIKTKLDKQDIPTPSGFVTKNKYGWSKPTIHRFAKSRYLIGEKNFKMLGIQYCISDYYPPLCTEEEFAIIQSNIAARDRGRIKCGYESLITGFRKCVCTDCGYSVSSVIHKIPRESLRYKCINQASCGWSIDAFIVEDTVIRLCLDKLTFSDTGYNQGMEVLAHKDQELKEIVNQINNIGKAIQDGVASRTLTKQLVPLEEKEDSLREEINELKNNTKSFIGVDYNKSITELHSIKPTVLQYKNVKVREKARDIIKSVVKKISLQRVSRGTVIVEVEFMDGDSRKALRKCLKQFGIDEMVLLKANPVDSPEEGKLVRTAFYEWGNPPKIITDPESQNELLSPFGIVMNE